jgi:hypothetical protein
MNLREGVKHIAETSRRESHRRAARRSQRAAPRTQAAYLGLSAEWHLRRMHQERRPQGSVEDHSLRPRKDPVYGGDGPLRTVWRAHS